jgi:hypothetical protein
MIFTCEPLKVRVDMCAIEPKFFFLPSHSVCTLLDLRHFYAMTYGSIHFNDHLAPLSSSSGEIAPLSFFLATRISRLLAEARQGRGRHGGAWGQPRPCAQRQAATSPPTHAPVLHDSASATRRWHGRFLQSQ